MKIINIAVCLLLFNGCAVSTMYGKKVYVAKPFELHLLGSDSLKPWIIGNRGGLWWSNGTTQRIYLEGVVFKGKLIPKDI